MKGNSRVVKNDCKIEIFDGFIKRLKNIPQLALKGYKPATESVTQERYAFACEDEHISVVYETNSRTLVITAEEVISKLLECEFEIAEGDISNVAFAMAEVITKPSAIDSKPPDIQKDQKKGKKTPIRENPSKKTQDGQAKKAAAKEKTAKTTPVIDVPADVQPPVQNQQIPAQNTRLKPKSTQSKSEKPSAKNKNTDASTSQKQEAASQKQKATNKKPETAANTKQDTANKNQDDANKKPASAAQKKSAPFDKLSPKSGAAGASPHPTRRAEGVAPYDPQPSAPSPQSADELYKNGFSIKKFEPQKFEDALKKIKALPGAVCRQNAMGDYIIEEGKNKVYMRYAEGKNTLQLQGRRSKLFGEVQIIVSQGSDFVTAVSSHIDLTGEEKRARDMEKRLKKLLPAAFEFLSEQSRIDLTIGMMDIGNDEVRLSDYSMLLVPPYRGLERLIFDLQRARGIEVKMIGQAFEKQDGLYLLKLGYRKKSGSIVFAEVMSALYSEYFAKRNFYAHSDITGDLLSRVITEKAAVKDIFANLVRIIEYNIGKLKETGFKL
ncbi:MAG: hypothetical protein FWE84_03590 [Firmicutes bacterium]|nr:hypothetical protein [Bacillota bacterium]